MARVAGLWVYPVKSLGGVGLDEAVLERRGLRHDRRWMIVDAKGRHLSQREHPKLAAVRVAREPDRLVLDIPAEGRHAVPLEPPDGPRRKVRIWGDEALAVAAAPAIDPVLSAYLDKDVALVRFLDDSRGACDPDFAPADAETGFSDGFPVLVTGDGSLEALNRAVVERGGEAVPMARFRPNIVLESLEPGAEDEAATLAIDETTLLLVKPWDRCVITTIDQDKGVETGEEPIASLRATRRNPRTGEVMFGQNAVPVPETG